MIICIICIFLLIHYHILSIRACRKTVSHGKERICNSGNCSISAINRESFQWSLNKKRHTYVLGQSKASVSSIRSTIRPQPVPSSNGIHNSFPSRCTGKPCIEHRRRLIENIFDEHRSACKDNSEKRNVLILVANVADDFLIELFKI